ncbi:MAG TPA: DNA-binding domain-containing protein, partial [Bryobacteraceae bacterium]|nr:DNA-binding domain-containing protein [Bryobacteraceae bacterium]
MGTDPALDPDLTLVDLTLEKVQRWMLACILGPRTSEETVVSEAARGWVLPSKTLSAIERLEIYRDMYLPRMEEALAIDYPALKHFLGGQEFMRLVKRYVDVYPSRSYTLNRL